METLRDVDNVVVSATAGMVIAFLATVVVVPLTTRLARRLGIVDEPGVRSSHVIATPRLGGIGVSVGALVGLATAALLAPTTLDRATPDALPLALVFGGAALLFGLIGLADDLLRGIPVSVRLLAQLVVGIAMVVPWVVAERSDDGATMTVAVMLLAAVGVMWVVGYVNAFNFMDGVDGMSGFIAIVVGLDLAVVGGIDDRAPLVVAGLVIAGSAAGFLPYNLRRSTVFLGDGGSYFMGAWIGMTVIVGIGLDLPPEAVLAVTAPYLADTSTTLVRRVARRADWRASHHEHAYQQLVDQGRSHLFVSALVAGASALCAALGLISLFAGPVARATAVIAVVAVAAAYVASPAALRRYGPVIEAPRRQPALPIGDEVPRIQGQREHASTSSARR